MTCNDCGVNAKSYFDKNFYDVGEGAWVTDCGTGGCGFTHAKTREESRELFRIHRSNENEPEQLPQGKDK